MILSQNTILDFMNFEFVYLKGDFFKFQIHHCTILYV